MKKIITLILLLSATIAVSAQKMTIKTASGQKVEISCDGIVPAEVQVEGDKVTFKMNNKAESVAEAPKAEATENAEVITDASEEAKDDFVEVNDSTATAEADVAESDTETGTEPEVVDELVDSGEKPSFIGSLANGLAEELSPEYAAFNKQHENDNPQEVMTNLAKGLVGDETYENISFISSLFKGLRFTKDSTFVPAYEQRKPMPEWRHYDVFELSGSFGQNIEGVSDAMAEKVSEADYGDDTENEHKFGGGIKYSRTYLKGEQTDKGWKPNPLGLALSWGGLLDYAYEKDLGSYVSLMGKVGAQIGTDITIGVDGLFGGGITPYNTFYSNGINHSMLNKSAFCVKYGVQLWGSLNYSKNTYTAIYARYIRSIKPSSAMTNLPQGWEVVVEDFDPSNWTVGLAVGYKFGAPKELSTDKRLQAILSTGYQFIGKQKGMLLAAEVDRLTKVSPSTTLTYGLSVEELFGQNDSKERYTSVLLSGGFKVNQPNTKWFWGAKAYAGVGDCAVKLISVNGENNSLENTTKKLCLKTALQILGGFKLSKLSEIYAACRFGYHFGKAIGTDGFDGTKYENLNAFSGDFRLGYKYTF